ncbi:MAG: hypothetical protein IH596_12375 [Bacteroidales bacterium]|nr:hypothetical protein [Bacteroidales bacterium]
MRLQVFTGIFFLFFTNLLFAQTPDPSAKSSSIGFIENKGQVIDQNNKPNPEVLYLLNTPGMNVQLRASGWSYDIYKLEPVDTLPLAFRNSYFAKEKLANNYANSE